MDVVYVLCSMHDKQGLTFIIIHYKDRMTHVNDIDLFKYEGVDLYTDVRSLASKSGRVFPKFAGLQWHPPNKENQRWPLDCDDDWLRLASYWEGKKHKVIHIYWVDLKKASNIQLTVASIDRGKNSEVETKFTLS